MWEDGQACFVCHPKGIASIQPRLAPNAYPACAFGTGNNANGVAAHSPNLRQRRYVGYESTKFETTSTRLWPFVRES